MFKEIIQQTYILDREAKRERLDRETTMRVKLINAQKKTKDLKVLAINTSGMDSVITEGYAYPSMCMIVWIGWVRLPSICLVIRADGYAYPGCKVIRTLASVEIEIMLILGLPCCLSSSVRCLESDPYEAIRQAYLVRMDTKSEPFKGETETHESPHTIAPPTCRVEESQGTGTYGVRSTSLDSTTLLFSDHLLTYTTPVLVSSLRRTARMAVRVSPAMSPTSLSEEDEEIKESLDLDSESEDADDEGPTEKDEDPAARDEGHTSGDEVPSMVVESLGLGGDEAVPKGQQRVALVVKTAMNEPLGLGYEALRCQEIALGEGQMPSVFMVDPKDGIAYIDVPTYPSPAPPIHTPPSPEWASSSLPVSLTPYIVPSPIS
nr:hypothetical protein [Tanacetum cinerariifolium]